MNCWVVPFARLGSAGVTSIETRVAAVTVRVVEPESNPEVAAIVVTPSALALASPSDPPAFEMVATPSSEDDHVTAAVRSCVEASVKVPVAVNCCVVPFAMLGSAGVTSIETSAAAVTVRVVEPEIRPDVAVIVVTPAALALARPSEPRAFEIVATTSSEEDHVTAEVRSWVVASVYVPVAVNCCVVPFAMLGSAGVTAIDTSAAALTVNVVVPEIKPDVAVIVVEPSALALARPSEPRAFEIVATTSSDEDHVTAEVRSWVEASVYVPVAVNCCVVPLAMLGSGGVTSIDTSAAAVTVNVVAPEIRPDVAVIVVTPVVLALARPSEPRAFEIVATTSSDEDHVTARVRSWVVASVYVPVAVNCCAVPFATLGSAVVTSIVTSVAAVTVNVVVPEITPEMAVIVVTPTAVELARPSEPRAFEIVAIASSEDDHVTETVRSWVVVSEKTPVAVNCCAVPLAMLGSAGVTSIETSVAAVTVSVVEPEITPDVAVIVVAPTAAALARPSEPPALEIVAIASTEDDHVTVAVRSWVVASEKTPVAVNCCVVPFAMLGSGGVTSIETRAAVVTVRVVDPEIPPKVAVIVVEPTATALARPSKPRALEIVATPSSEDDQVADAVRSCVVASVKSPVAANCCVVPLAMPGSGGVTSIETRPALVTVTSVLPEMMPSWAVMMVEPTRSPLTVPFAGTAGAPFETVATETSEELQVTWLVRSAFVLLE